MDNNLEEIVLAGIFQDEKMEYTDFDKLSEKYFTGLNKDIFNRLVKYRKIKGLPYDMVIADQHFLPKQLMVFVSGIRQLSSTCFIPEYISMLQNKYLTSLTTECIKKYTDTGNLDFVELQQIIKEHIKNTSKFKIFDFQKNLPEYSKYLDDKIANTIKTYKTHIEPLDHLIGKIYPGTLITIGGRTSLGKTSLSIQIAFNIAKNKIPVLFLSAEMSDYQLIDKIVSRQTKIDLYDISNGIIEKDKIKEVNNMLNKLHNIPFYISEISQFNMEIIEKLITQTQAEVVFVDYIQRFTLPQAETRASAFSEIANGLKTIARDNNIVVFTASQLNRQAVSQHKEKQKEVDLSQLKESGGIEEASDLVILLEDKKIENPTTKEILFRIAKNRTGRTGELNFIFHKSTCNFEIDNIPYNENGIKDLH